MKLDLKWVFKKPIDMEHKDYVLLDYISKVDKELEEFQIYPTFQELSIHLANLKAVQDDFKYIQLRELPEDIDDEVLMYNVMYKKINRYIGEDREDIKKIAKDAHKKLKDYFLIAKSIWSIVFDSVLIRPFTKDQHITNDNKNRGYLIFNYRDNSYLYEFNIRKLNDKFDEEKCEFKLIKKNSYIILKEEIDIENNIVFVAEFNEDFPLEGCLLSITKRKVMNYIQQSIRIFDLKNHEK
jgi:hypothetical protein